MRKRNLLCCILLSVIMVLGGWITSFAAAGYTTFGNIETDVSSVDTSSYEVIIDIPQEVVDKSEKAAEEQIMMNLNRLRMPEYEYKLRKSRNQCSHKD